MKITLNKNIELSTLPTSTMNGSLFFCKNGKIYLFEDNGGDRIRLNKQTHIKYRTNIPDINIPTLFYDKKKKFFYINLVTKGHYLYQINVDAFEVDQECADKLIEEYENHMKCLRSPIYQYGLRIR